MISDDQMERIRYFAEEKMSKDDRVHGWDHVVRVLRTCRDIIDGEHCNENIENIVFAAAYLHDVGRSVENLPENDGINHAILSYRMANPFLLEIDVDVNDAVKIVHCILSHSFSSREKPQTIEAMVLTDADKIDMLGIWGVYRMISYQIRHENGWRDLAEIMDEKFLRLYDQLHTETAKQIAKPRHEMIKHIRRELREEFGF